MKRKKQLVYPDHQPEKDKGKGRRLRGIRRIHAYIHACMHACTHTHMHTGQLPGVFGGEHEE